MKSNGCNPDNDDMLVAGVLTILYQSRPGDSCELVFSGVKLNRNLGAIKDPYLHQDMLRNTSESIIPAGEHSFIR